MRTLPPPPPILTETNTTTTHDFIRRPRICFLQVQRNGIRDIEKKSSSSWNKLTPRVMDAGRNDSPSGGGSGSSGNGRVKNGSHENGRVVSQLQRQQQELRQLSDVRRGSRKNREHHHQQLHPSNKQHHRRQQEGSAIAATTTATAFGPSRQQTDGAARVGLSSANVGGDAEMARGERNRTMVPWAKAAVSKAWEMSASAGSACSFSDGGSGGGNSNGVVGVSGHHHNNMPSPNHASSTELAMSLYGGGSSDAGGGRSRSLSRRLSV